MNIELKNAQKNHRQKQSKRTNISIENAGKQKFKILEYLNWKCTREKRKQEKRKKKEKKHPLQWILDFRMQKLKMMKHLKKNAKLVLPYLSKNNVDFNLLFSCKLLPWLILTWQEVTTNYAHAMLATLAMPKHTICYGSKSWICFKW